MASPYAKIRKAYGGIPADAMLQEVIPLEELAALARNQANKVVSEDQPGTYKQKNRQSESFSIAGPASNEEIIPMLKLSGFKMKDDGTVDMDQFKSRQIPELEELKKFQMSRPSEPNLEGLAMALSALGGTEVKAPKRDRTADMNLKDYAEIGAAIQNQRDEEMKRQSDLFKAITGVTSVRQSGTKVDDSDVTMTNPQPPAPRSSGKGPAKPKGLTPAQQKEIEQYNDAIKEAQTVVSLLGDNKGYVGLLDAWKPNVFLGKGHAAFRQQLGLLMDPYRSKVTGQAAADKELARIEGRLPKESDKYENFTEKAKNYIRYMEEARNRRLSTYGNQGIDVSAFAMPSGLPGGGATQTNTQSVKSPQERAAELLKKRAGAKSK